MSEAKQIRPSKPAPPSEGDRRQMNELEVLIRARYPLIYVISWEEQRVLARVLKIASKLGKNVFEWSITTGLVPAGTSIQSQKHRDTATQDPLGAMTACGFDWLKPTHLVRTHDSYYNSVLDFIFLANYADVMSGKSEIVVRPNDFPDDNTTPDHRPVKGVLTIISPTNQPLLRDQILQRITQLEQELASLRTLAEQMPN